jgi:hypothetical protein
MIVGCCAAFSSLWAGAGLKTDFLAAAQSGVQRCALTGASICHQASRQSSFSSAATSGTPQSCVVTVKVLLEVPALALEVVRTTGDVTEFRNGSCLEISSNDAALVRGRNAIAVLGSECAHRKVDERSASSDEEVVAAAEPSMAMCPDGGVLLLGSSVHRRAGYMYRKFRELHGNDEAEDVCWFVPSIV